MLATTPHIHKYIGNDSIPGFSECECGITMSVIPGNPYPKVTLRGIVIACPNHGGNYDCTPFCNLCEGEQEYEVVEND